MTSLSENEKNDILKKIDYDNMRIGTTATLYQTEEGGSWDKASETTKSLYAYQTVTVARNITSPTYTLSTQAGLVEVRTNPHGAKAPISQVNVAIGSAQLGTSVSATSIEAKAGVSLIGGSVSAVDFNVGVGVSSGIGINDDSVQAKLAGCGVTIGRKIGISVLDTSVSIDLGKLFGGW